MNNWIIGEQRLAMTKIKFYMNDFLLLLNYKSVLISWLARVLKRLCLNSWLSKSSCGWHGCSKSCSWICFKREEESVSPSLVTEQVWALHIWLNTKQKCKLGNFVCCWTLFSERLHVWNTEVPVLSLTASPSHLDVLELREQLKQGLQCSSPPWQLLSSSATGRAN